MNHWKCLYLWDHTQRWQIGNCSSEGLNAKSTHNVWLAVASNKESGFRKFQNSGTVSGMHFLKLDQKWGYNSICLVAQSHLTLHDPTDCRKVKRKGKWKCYSLSCVQFFTTPWSTGLQAPLSVGFSRQEYWNGLPFPTPYNPISHTKSISLHSVRRKRDIERGLEKS